MLPVARTRGAVWSGAGSRFGNCLARPKRRFDQPGTRKRHLAKGPGERDVTPRNQATWLSKAAARRVSGTEPTICSTGWPPLNRSIVGIPRTLKR